MSNNDDLLSPDYSPVRGIKRLNKNPLYIGIGIAVVFILSVVFISLETTSSSNNGGIVDKPKASARESTSRLISDMPRAKPMPTEVEDIDEIMTQLDLILGNDQLLPEVQAPAPVEELDEDLKRIKQLMSERFVATFDAELSVELKNKKATGSVAQQSYRNSDYDAQINEIDRQISMNQSYTAYSDDFIPNPQLEMNTPPLPYGGSVASGSEGRTNSINKYDQLARNPNNWELTNTVEAVKSPYTIRTGNTISGVLITGINSDISGTITAQVTQNVYDSVTGQHLLVPQGSKLIGTYDDGVIFGQKRVLVAWNRVVFPNGDALDIGAMQGTDALGHAGFNDKVNNHYMRTFGSAILMSLVTGGTAYALDKNSSNNNNDTTVGSAMREAFAAHIGELTIEMLRKSMNVSPTIEIRPGFRFNILVTKDMVFSKPYRY